MYRSGENVVIAILGFMFSHSVNDSVMWIEEIAVGFNIPFQNQLIKQKTAPKMQTCRGHAVFT